MVNWSEIIGRVSFVNCDPLFHNLSQEWSILPAPPAWLTGHLLRKDCLVAPIPAADYAANSSELILLPDIGIASEGAVGSVLLFSNRELGKIRDIALPTDSSTSRILVLYILSEMGLYPKTADMGPDLKEMLSKCDAALLIGDRALDEAQRCPELVKMDLGEEWQKLTGLPMVFGVFAAPSSAPVDKLKQAHNDLLSNAINFRDKPHIKDEVIRNTATRSGFSIDRINEYFNEVTNILSPDSVRGLEFFLTEVCGLETDIEWLDV